MAKSKALKRRLQGRRRYVAFALKEKMNLNALTQEIKKQVSHDAQLRMIYDKYDHKKKRGIVLVSHKKAHELIHVLHGMGIETLGTSGILKKAYERYIAQ